MAVTSFQITRAAADWRRMDCTRQRRRVSDIRVWILAPPSAGVMRSVPRTQHQCRSRSIGESVCTSDRSRSRPIRTKVTIFLTDMTHFDDVVELRRRWFTPPYPADTIVEVRSLYLPEAMFEIEAVAVVDEAAQWLDRM